MFSPGYPDWVAAAWPCCWPVWHSVQRPRTPPSAARATVKGTPSGSDPPPRPRAARSSATRKRASKPGAAAANAASRLFPNARIALTAPSGGLCVACQTSADCEVGIVCDATHHVCRSCASRDECAPVDAAGNRFCNPLFDRSEQSRCTNLDLCDCPGTCADCGNCQDKTPAAQPSRRCSRPMATVASKTPYPAIRTVVGEGSS